MPIISYSGEFGKDGQVVSTTRATVECPLCRQVRETSVFKVRQHSDKCTICSHHGAPVYETEARNLYPEIRKVLKYGVRGDVTSNSPLIVECPECHREHTCQYGGLKRAGAFCNGCHNGSIPDKWKVFPKDLPECVLSHDPSTLSTTGRVKTFTKLVIKCKCGREFERTWAGVKFAGYTCENCSHAVAWKDEEYRKKMLEMPKLNGSLSKLHQNVKDAMVESGISGFESERYFGGFARVDEINRELKVVLEVNGDWWHFNPKIYAADKIAQRHHKLVTAAEVWKYDAERIARIEALGYKVYIIWESDFRADPQQSIQDFAEWIDALPLAEIQTSRASF